MSNVQKIIRKENKVSNKTQVTEITSEKPSLKRLQALVGGYIEIAFDDGYTQIICNDEGLLGGLPYNKDATEYWRGRVHSNVRKYHRLYGDVVILKEKGRLV